MLNKKIFNFVFINFIMVACNSMQMVNVKDNSGANANNYETYMRGCVDYMSGDYNSAMQNFEKLEKTENSIYAKERYIRFLFETNQFDKIVNLDQKVKDVFKGNLDIEKIFAQSYLHLGHGEKASNFINKLIKENPHDLQLSYFKVLNLIKTGKLDEALTVIDECIKDQNLESKQFLFYFLASKVYLQKNMEQQALKYINKSLELFPDFERGWLLKAIIQEQQGQIQGAIAGYKRFLDIVGSDETVEKQLIRLLFVEKRFDEASDVLEKVKDKTPTQIFDLSLINWRAGKADIALSKLDELLAQNPDFKDAKFLKIEILVSTGKSNMAMDILKDWLIADPENKEVLQVLLLLRRAKVDVNSIIKVLELVEKNSSNQNLVSALIDLNFEKNDRSKVLSYCKKLFDITKDNGLKSKILFQTAYIRFISGQNDKVEAILLNALKYQPAYSSIHNLLAYFYAQNNLKLEDALVHIDLALKEKPESYYYIDTKGFVLFKMGKTEDAINMFEKALSFNANDSEVLKHLEMAKSVGK
ncbi:hypothetical protein KJ644_01855 [Candidatus Dependentiae bacterium]|nr:hypothetical protein [Candidatus Dependentiae bacterium]MBU4387196.1 hypothetical protein [Candidatus Dependentiae bacterium]MCG2756176.1 hypothetical protein [Candidatus Dependentiae bacterium]